MPLQSRSGFFNVSLRSLAVGQNTTNSLHDPLGAGADVSYTPLNSNLTVNLANASSAYNLQIKDNDKEFVSLKYVDAEENLVTVTSKSSDPQSITRMEQLAGPVCPIGTCQINRTGSDIHVTATGVGVAEHSMNAPFNYSTRCDDYVATIPDSTFQSGSITVVLTSCADVWVPWLHACLRARLQAASKCSCVRTSMSTLMSACAEGQMDMRAIGECTCVRIGV